jgi:S1-C subfamily serine protease
MKRTVVLCVLAAMAGGLFSGTWMGLVRPPESVAQTNGEEPAAEPAAPTGAPQAQPPAAEPGMRITSDPHAMDDYTPDERVNIGVYDFANRSVVNITTKGYHGDRFLFMEIPSSGEGSGAILDKAGHIVTNFHVVEGAEQIQVTLFNNKSYEAKLVGRDRDTDVAVVRISAPAEELHPVVFGNSSGLRVGQRVFALGNPFGLERTLSTGIVSSLDRWIPSRFSKRRIKQIIQIDAAINPGNSGGPLLDSHARIIGMNTAIASKTGESAGVGFAIPINTIARVVPQLIRTGRVVRPDAGIARVYETEKGIQIATLTPNGPAERAGLQGPRVVRQQKRQGPFVYQYQTIDRAAADLIVSVDGQAIKTGDDFLSAIDAKRPGDTVTLGVIRGGRETKVPLQLDQGD